MRTQEADYAWRKSALLIADDNGASLADLLAAAGARLAGTCGLADAVARLANQGPLDLIAIDAEAADAAVLASVIDAVVRFADRGACAVVATIAPAQIDLVGAAMLGGRYTVLCAPDDAERFAAIAVALGTDGKVWLNDAGRDSEAERLRRLNDEVARIAQTLARLTGVEPGSSLPSKGVTDRSVDYRAEPADTAPISAAELRQTIRARRLRDQMLGDGLFEDPAWDMMLDLYAAHLERAQVSVSSLCIAAAVAPTTALRWIARLTDAGLFERNPDPFDRRRAFMALSATTLAQLTGYFQALRCPGGVPLV